MILGKTHIHWKSNSKKSVYQPIADNFDSSKQFIDFFKDETIFGSIHKFAHPLVKYKYFLMVFPINNFNLFMFRKKTNDFSWGFFFRNVVPFVYRLNKRTDIDFNEILNAKQTWAWWTQHLAFFKVFAKNAMNSNYEWA